MLDAGLYTTVLVGPFNLPVWALLLIAAYACGFIYTRVAYRKNREIRLHVSDRVSSLVLISFLVWKIAPVLTNLKVALKEPLYILYATGSVVSICVGFAAGVAFFVLSLRKLATPELRRAVVFGTARVLSVAVVAFVLGLLVSVGISAGKTDGTGEAQAPDFTLVTLSGEKASLSDYRGKTVILNFWATWCPPCRAELPILATFSEEADPERIVVLSVNQTAGEESLDTLRVFADATKINFPVFLDGDNRVFTQYGVRGIPTTFLIDPDGNIASRRYGVVSRSWLERQE